MKDTSSPVVLLLSISPVAPALPAHALPARTRADDAGHIVPSYSTQKQFCYSLCLACTCILCNDQGRMPSQSVHPLQEPGPIIRNALSSVVLLNIIPPQGNHFENKWHIEDHHLGMLSTKAHSRDIFSHSHSSSSS
eukprot:1154657-Pelagomonas_calceolata.AAC.4